MEFRIGIVIGASLWLVTEQQQPDHDFEECTSLSDIAEPCGCVLTPETLDPICGSDNSVYLSMCFLNCWAILENIKIEVGSACAKLDYCACDDGQYDPVCGSDGITYSNECILNCHIKDNPITRITLKHHGECGLPKRRRIASKRQGCPNQPQAWTLRDAEKKAKTNMCVCAMLHRPVCSNHNTTYPNFCVLDCIARRNPSVEFQHWGVCGKPQKTPYG